MSTSYSPELATPSQTLEIPPIALRVLADILTETAVQYSQEPYVLRAGGSSHYYIDGRGPATMHASRGLFIARLALARWNLSSTWPEAVVGMGVGGRALAMNIGWVSDMPVITANDSTSKERYGYGLHGADIAGKDVVVVDDTLSTGDSLITTIQMARDAGAAVCGALTVFDRSDGVAADHVQQECGVQTDWLFSFDEASGRLFPNI